MVGVRESLLGPSYFYHRSLIKQSKGWSPSKIREYQDTRFQRLVRRYGDEITQKEDYQRYRAGTRTGTCRCLPTRCGPGGHQVSLFASRPIPSRAARKSAPTSLTSGPRWDTRPYDLRVRYAGDIHGGMLRYNRFENMWIVSPGATVEGELGRLRQWMRTLSPFFLHVYPSSLYTFIDLVGENLFRSLPIRGVIAASEMFSANEQARFEQEFGIKIAHWYGHSEYAVLAYCCRECRGFHFYPTYGCVELLSSETEGCRRVVASSFNRIGTQFVRYDTGDLAVDPVGSCANDRFPRASAIVGRSQETFIDSSGRRRSLYGYAFGDLDHDAFYDQIRDIQFVQDKAGSLRVRIVTNPGAERDQIQQAFEQRIPMARLEFEYVSVIERSPSGKRRYFVDTLNTDAIGSNGHPRTPVTNKPMIGAVAAEVERLGSEFHDGCAQG